MNRIFMAAVLAILALPLIAVLTVGVSLGLPLFLYLRERTLEHGRTQANTAAV
jgi:uncharacterized protein DUF2834